jgi:myo-inositol catabolism protein IolS
MKKLDNHLSDQKMEDKRWGPSRQLRFFPLAFGGGAVSGEGKGYSFGKMSTAEAEGLLRYAFERGVNVYDTAPIYGYGESEKRIGAAFKRDREKVFLINKGGVTWVDKFWVRMTNERKVIEEMFYQSLKTMQTDYIDLYMIHWPDPKVDIRVPMEFLERCREKGLIAHLGLCNTNLADLQKAKEIAPIEVVQSEFHLLEKRAQTEMFPYLKENKISFMPWGTLDKGIIAGTVRDEQRHYDDCDVRQSADWWKKDKGTRVAKFEKMQELRRYLKDQLGEEVLADLGGEEKGITQLLLALALDHNLRPPEVITTLVGGKSKEQWDALFLARDQEHLITEKMRSEIAERLQ